LIVIISNKDTKYHNSNSTTTDNTHFAFVGLYLHNYCQNSVCFLLSLNSLYNLRHSILIIVIFQVPLYMVLVRMNKTCILLINIIMCIIYVYLVLESNKLKIQILIFSCLEDLGTDISHSFVVVLVTFAEINWSQRLHECVLWWNESFIVHLLLEIEKTKKYKYSQWWQHWCMFVMINSSKWVNWLVKEMDFCRCMWI
jgi:hypothetical protein